MNDRFGSLGSIHDIHRGLVKDRVIVCFHSYSDALCSHVDSRNLLLNLLCPQSCLRTDIIGTSQAEGSD